MFFDNLQVTHTAGHILEETHYYPFGLAMAGISSRALNNIAPNNYKFNAGNELNESFGINLYETFYRLQDVQTGRFLSTDPLAEKYYGITTYNYAANNPVSINDPLGDQMKYPGDNGRMQKGPDGEYHVGWVSEMMWEYPTSFSFGSGMTEGGDFSTYWNYIINANFGDGVDLPTSIIANIPGFGESYFGNVNGAWGFFNSATNAGYTGNNSEINALVTTLIGFATSGNPVVNGRFFEMLGGKISHNIYTDRNQISTLNGIERDASGTVVRTNTFFSTQANGRVPENRIPNNGATNYRAQFVADFLSITYLNAKYGKVYPSNQIANGYFNNGKVLWLQGNQASQRPQYGTQGQFVQSSKNAADRAYIENVTLNNYGYPQRTFYMSLFMSAGGNQLEHSRLGYSGGLRDFYGIFMIDNFHF